MAVTWNSSDKSTYITLSGSDLVVESTSSTYPGTTRCTQSHATGKWYFEVVVSWSGSYKPRVGVATSLATLDHTATSQGLGTDQYGWAYGCSGAKYNNGGIGGYSSLSSGDVVAVAADLDAGDIWFGYVASGTNYWFGTGANPVTGAVPAFSNLSGSTVFAACSICDSGASSTATARFKAEDFSGTIPSGFSAWEQSVPEVSMAVALGNVIADIAAISLGPLDVNITSLLDNIQANISCFSATRITTAIILDSVSASLSVLSPNIHISLDWPSRLLLSDGESRDGTATLTWPTRTLTAYSGGSVALIWPGWSLTAVGTVERIGTAELTWPTWVLSAEGLTGGVGFADLVWPTCTLNAYSGGAVTLVWSDRTLIATGVLEAVGATASMWPGWELTATGLVGGIGAATLAWSDWALAAEGLMGSVGVVSLHRPSLILTATDSIVTTETTYAVNLSTGAVTQLMLGAFDKLVTAHGRLYGLQNGTMFCLGGDTNQGAEIPVTIRFASQQFGTNLAKRINGRVYLNSRANNGMILTLIEDETRSWQYQTGADIVPAMGTHSAKVGRGITFHSLGFIVQNKNGEQLDIGGLEIPVIQLARRLK